MKKLLSVLLVMAVVMSFATVMSVSADEREDLVSAGASQDVETAAADGNVSVGAGTDTEATGTSGSVYLEKPDWGKVNISQSTFGKQSRTVNSSLAMVHRKNVSKKKMVSWFMIYQS